MESTMAASNEGALITARNENQVLRESLQKLKETHQQVVDDRDIQLAKALELQDIVIAKSQNEIEDALLQKSLRNAELSFQLDRMHMQLQQERTSILKMAQEREGKKRMLLELSDIVRTLQTVAIQYSADQNEAARTRPEDMALSNIKRKIQAIMDDRAKLIEQCKLLQAENEAKDEKVAVLESHFHILNASNADAISVSSELSEKLSSDNSADGRTVNVEKSDHSTVCDTPSMDGSKMSDSSRSTQQSYQKGLAHVKTQLAEARRRFQNLKQESQKVLIIISNIEKKLIKSKAETAHALQKRDAYRTNLQDAIAQYKQLEADHKETKTKMDEAKAELDEFKHEKELLETEKEQLGIEAQQWKSTELDAMQSDAAQIQAAYNHAVDHVRVLERQVTLLIQETGVLKKQKANQATSLRDAIFKHRSLEREFSVLEETMTETKKKMDMAKREEHRHKEQAKLARRRMTTSTQQVKSLQEELEETLAALLEAKAANHKDNIEMGWSQEMQHQMILVEVRTTARAWINKRNLSEEKRRLVREHEEMKRCSEDILRELDDNDRKHQDDNDPSPEIEKVKRRLTAREGDLRDVIHQYKRLEQKYTVLVSKVKTASRTFDLPTAAKPMAMAGCGAIQVA